MWRKSEQRPVLRAEQDYGKPGEVPLILGKPRFLLTYCSPDKPDFVPKTRLMCLAILAKLTKESNKLRKLCKVYASKVVWRSIDKRTCQAGLTKQNETNITRMSLAFLSLLTAVKIERGQRTIHFWGPPSKYNQPFPVSKYHNKLLATFSEILLTKDDITKHKSDQSYNLLLCGGNQTIKRLNKMRKFNRLMSVNISCLMSQNWSVTNKYLSHK